MSVQAKFNTIVSRGRELLKVEQLDLTPCDSNSLSRLQKVLVVPAELVSLLEITDGHSGLFGPWEFLSAEDVIKTHAELMEPPDGNADSAYPEWDFQEPKPFLFDKGWRQRWIPIAQQNYEEYIFLDGEPGPGGQPGQVGLRDAALELTLLAGSLEEYFDSIPARMIGPDHPENIFEDCVWLL